MKKKVLSLLMTLAVVFGMAPAAIMADEGNTIAMKNMTAGGTTYYYADAAGAAEGTAFTFSVTTGRGANATTTNYSYTKAELNRIENTDYYYIVKPGTAALSGTLYGYGEGTATTYQEIYNALGVATDDSFDVVSSATHYSSHHSKDIPSNVIYGKDKEGNKAITGLNLSRSIKTVDAKAYVESSILKSAGKQLTPEQEAVLNITLKTNPTTAPRSGAIPAKFGHAEYTFSKYGAAEINVYPDETVNGYVWSEYMSNIYAATISDGTNTAGAVYWIDLYGEPATSGYHYNKVEFELNNGMTKAENATNVNRFAAFFDQNTGKLRSGTYTITVYSEGYAPVSGSIKIDVALKDKKAVYNGKPVSIDKAVLTGVDGEPEYTYYADAACTKALKSAPVNAGVYYVRATVADVVSNTAKLTIGKAANKITKISPLSKKLKVKKLKKAKSTFNLKATVAQKAGATWKVSKYITKKAKKYITVSKAGKVTVKKGTPKGIYKIKVTATSKALANYESASVTKMLTISVK